MSQCTCHESDSCPLHGHFPEDEPAQRSGQGMPADAGLSARIEAAAAMLLLESPLQLLEALRDAGLRAVSTADYPPMQYAEVLPSGEIRRLDETAMRAILKRIASGLDAAGRADFVAMLSRGISADLQLAQHHAQPDLDAMNRGRALAGMPPLSPNDPRLRAPAPVRELLTPEPCHPECSAAGMKLAWLHPKCGKPAPAPIQSKQPCWLEPNHAGKCEGLDWGQCDDEESL